MYRLSVISTFSSNAIIYITVVTLLCIPLTTSTILPSIVNDGTLLFNRTGILSCNNFTTRVHLHSVITTGGDGLIYSINSSAAILKIPRTYDADGTALDATIRNDWINLHKLYPPIASNNFLQRYVPSTFSCSFSDDLSATIPLQVLLKERIHGFDLNNIPISFIEPTTITEAFRGVELHKQIRSFLTNLAIYEYNQEEHSLFDIRPSNIMFGNNFIRVGLNHSNIVTIEQLLTPMPSTTTCEKKEKIWLVDFTIHDHSVVKFYRPDYIWNDKQNELLWAKIKFPKNDRGGISFVHWFEQERAQFRDDAKENKT